MTEAAFTLRDATADDIAAVTAIYADAVLTGTASYEIEPPDMAEMARRFAALASDGFPSIVADGAGGVLGYAYAGPFRARPAYRYLVEDSVYIAAEARGRGLRRALLDRLVALSSERGFRQMVAVIGDAAGSEASVRLHAACGFRTIGRIKGSGFKHGRWLDTLLMQRALGAGASELP
jgi:L-amino acid N-acyltransferase YncA